MEKNILKGIALILFGILLGIGGIEINDIFFGSISDIPFATIGVIIGAIGLTMVFQKDTDKKEK